MSRNPACRPGSSRATAVAGHKPNLKNVKSTIPKQAPPPPKKDRTKKLEPRMTRAMQHRVKVAQQYKDDYARKEREREAAQQCRRPQRAAAPVGGDARLGRECPPRSARPAAKAPAAPRSRPTSAKSQPASRGPAACSTAAPPAAAARKAAACKPAPAATGAPKRKAAAAPLPPPDVFKPSVTCPKPGGGWPKSFAPGSKPAPREPPQPAPAPPAPPVPERTRNLAESMNADIVQAEPLQPGTVDNIIIPPGAINSEKTTIVSIPQPEVPPPAVEHHSTIAAGSPGTGPQNAANKSMQVISEALDEQDANEAAIVNSKLQDLQNARRDFVLAVANVGNNSLNLGDDDFNNIMDITPPELLASSSDTGCPVQSARLLDFSDIDDPCVPEYGSRHPVVESAREYMRTRQSYQQPDECDLLDPEYFEGCGLIGADDMANQLPVCGPTDNYTIIPRRRDQYQYQSGPVEQLERFFDLENYPPCPPSPVCAPPRPTGPPPGREHIHPDLWEIDDPWYHEPEQPDLIDWDSYQC